MAHPTLLNRYLPLTPVVGVCLSTNHLISRYKDLFTKTFIKQIQIPARGTATESPQLLAFEAARTSSEWPDLPVFAGRAQIKMMIILKVAPCFLDSTNSI